MKKQTILQQWQDEINGKAVNLQQVHNGNSRQDIAYTMNGREVTGRLLKKVIHSLNVKHYGKKYASTLLLLVVLLSSCTAKYGCPASKIPEAQASYKNK